MNRFKKFIWVGIAAVAIGGFVTFHVSLNSQKGSSVFYMANVEALSSESITDCTAFSYCSTNCPYEFCGYCNGFYMLECPKPNL